MRLNLLRNETYTTRLQSCAVEINVIHQVLIDRAILIHQNQDQHYSLETLPKGNHSAWPVTVGN